ncbi:plectin isoform X1 [Osmerus mordax]|uniref:plectin isoform X1 n=1 Tax=Osmerus mordax TaxID=8014 RepID=UPI003510C11B
MAAQVEVQTGEVGRTGVGGRLHLSPLVDSSNKSLVEGSSSPQGSLIISPEPGKPVPAPKPRLTPKPFSVERNPTVRPILAPKPHTKPRPEPNRPTSYKPDPPVVPKPEQPGVTGKHRPVSTNPGRQAPTTFKASPKLSAGQTSKPVAQPFKPAPPLTLGDPSKPAPPPPAGRHTANTAGTSPSRGYKKPQSAEWSGSTKQDMERGKTSSTARPGGTSMTRAKSMGFLNQMGQEEEERKLEVATEVGVALRPHPRSSRPRPVSAIFLPSPTETEAPSPASQWSVRRPLSADLTSRFESIGLSLHRRPTDTDSKENTPEEGVPPRRREREKGPEGAGGAPQGPEGKPKPSISRRGSEKTKEEGNDEKEEVRSGGGSIKRRISLLLDSSSSPGGRAIGQAPEPRSPAQPIPEVEVPLGIKQRIKQLTEDTPPAQTPSPKLSLRPRPLPLDLTKRFTSDRSPELGSPSLSEATDRLESDIDPQRRGEDSASFRDQGKVEEDSRGPPERPPEPASDPAAGRPLESGAQDRSLGGGVQTVRAALFENVVERHSVLVLDEDQGRGQALPRRSLSLKQREEENEGNLVTATYREPVSPSSPLRVEHSYDTVPSVGESRAVSESVPSAQLEDKAMTLRRRSDRAARAEPAEDQPPQGQGVFFPASGGGGGGAEKQPRYLRVGALQKWNPADLEREAEEERRRRAKLERQMGKGGKPEEEWETQREVERQMQMDVDREIRREKEREEVAAPKRLKMLEANELPAKPRATYFALTGQAQEVVSLGEDRAERGDLEVPFDDYSVKSGQWGSQGKVLPLHRTSPLDDALGKSLQSKVQDEDREAQRQLAQRQLEMERQVEFSQKMERENQKELERERQKELERQRQREMERDRQRAFERQQELHKQQELETERQREVERERQREVERERQREVERERQREVERERQREVERERQREVERERQREVERERQRELERQNEVEKERQLEMERQKLATQRELERAKEQERRQLQEYERQKQVERERQQLVELEKQRLREKAEREEAEKVRQMAIQQEVNRQRELERERERQQEREKERLKQLEVERQKEVDKERQRQLEVERQKEVEKERQKLAMQREQQRLEEFERVKEQERRQLQEYERQKQVERERQQLVELEKQRLREKAEREEAEKMRQVAIQQEVNRQRELERERERQQEREKERLRQLEVERQKEVERQLQRDLERQKQLDSERQELDRQRVRQRESEKERQRAEELERRNEMERRQLLEFEKQKQAAAQRQQVADLEMQRLREKMERDDAEKMRRVVTQQEVERQRMKDRQKREDQERADSSPLRPKVLDLDSVTRDDPFSPNAPYSSDPSSRWRRPSPRSEEEYRPAILDIDSFRSQAQLSPTKEVYPVAGNQGTERGSGLRSNLNTADREGGVRMAPEGVVRRPSPVRASSQQDPWERRPGEVVGSPLAGPEAPRKPANKPSLEQLLLRQEERAAASCLVPERRWAAVPGEPQPSAPHPVRDTSLSGSPAGSLDPWSSLEAGPHQLGGMETRSQRRSQGSQELNRMRSRSVSRRSTPATSTLEGSLLRMRSRSAHRERGDQDWEAQKQGVGGDEEGRDTDTLVHETDSQYGTWETGLRTDDSLTPATPTSEGNLSPSPGKATPPHTLGEQAPPSDLDTPDGLSPLQPEIQQLPFPEASTSLLDSSALRSRAQLSKKRGPRSRPTRAARQSAALAGLPEGQAGSGEDWRYRDSTEEKVQAKQEDSDSEEQARAADPRPAASQPQRVPLFPGMDPFALKAQLKKRGDSDNQTDGLASSPSQLSRSPKSPFLPRASRVLPPAGGKENGEEASPQWLRELKSKKRLSQYDNDS